MNQTSKILIATLITALLLLNVGVALETDLVKQVGTCLAYKSTHNTTDGDTIQNVPVNMNQAWFLNMYNTPDGQGPIFSPRIEVWTLLNLVQFHPNDPAIFTANPPFYTWNFVGLQVNQGAIVPIDTQEQQSALSTKPRFSITRTVEPQILAEEITLQTVTLTFKLEEPLPPPVDHLNILIGKPVIAYQGKDLVEGTFVSQNEVSGWTSTGYGTEATWTTDPSKIQISKIYTFQATLQSIKSQELQGAPIFKPGILVQYNHAVGLPPVTGTYAIVTMPDNSLSATFSVDNAVDWSRIYFDAYFDFSLGPQMSQITTEPPHHVLIPATVRIEPQTLNLKSNGIITAFLELPNPYNVQNVDVSTVRCQGAAAVKGIIADDTLILKFERQELQGLVGGQINIVVTGQLKDGSIFYGQSTIKTIK